MSYIYNVTKSYKRAQDDDFTPPQVIAEGSFLTDMQAIIRNRLERDNPRDECGALMQIRYEICVKGSPVKTFYIGEANV